MPKKQHSELVAGLFVLCTLAVLLGIVLWMGSASIFHPAREKAYFYIREGQDSGGIGEGTSLLIAGKEIGRVRSVYFDQKNGRTYYQADIQEADVKVHADGKAILQSAMVGDSTISVVRGTPGSPLANAPDRAIEITGGLFTALSDAASKLNEELDPKNPASLMTSIKSMMAILQAQMDPKVAGSLLAKIHDGVESLDKALASIQAEMDADKDGSILQNVKLASKDIKSFTQKSGPKLQETVDDIHVVSGKVKDYADRDLGKFMENMRQASDGVLKVSQDLAVVGEQARQVALIHRDDIGGILANMMIVSDNLKATSEEVRRNPWRLLYRPSENELKRENVYDAARAFVTGAESLDHAISRLNGLIKAHPQGVAATDPEILKVRQEVDESFKNFKKAEEALWEQLKVKPSK